ncbi:MAG TPA: PAS domain S-box protein, partial [Anaerolineales bacterium]
MGKPLHDLIIEDSKADTDLLLRELRRVGYEVEFERVETMEAMQVALTEKTWDLILSDYTMPKFSALQTLEVLKASRFDPPFIIISGTIGEEMAVAALKAGANNYLSKENLAKLGQVVEQELREAEIHLEHRQALKTSEELFGTAFHHSPVGICITTLDGKLQNISQSLLDMLGFTRAELEGKHFNDITYPDDLEIGKDAVGSMMAGKVPSVSFEKRYLHKSGEPVWALVSSSLLRDSSGQPVHFITHILDMTERKQAEEQIRAHAARLKVLADASQTFATAVQDYQVMLEMVARQTAEALGGSCGVRLLSEDGKWLEMVAMHDVDVAALKLTRTLSNQPLRADEPNFVQRVLQSQQALLMPGISEDQLRAVVKPEDWTHLKYIASHSRLLAPIRTRSEALGFLIISRKVGSPAFDEHDLSLAQDLADRAALAISNARLFKQVQNELTERKQTEESLRQSEERFSKAFEANQAAMALIRIDNLLILDVNNSFYELTGFTREEAIGHPSPELNFITPEERKRATEESQRQGGALHNFEMMVHRKDGGVRYALYSSERIDLEQVPCVLAILYDITERKRAEDALRES